MACELTRNDVSNIVLGILRRIHRDNTITEFSRFGIELLVDPFARATLYPRPITEEIKEEGCFLRVFGPSECQRAQDVEDIVTAAWNDVKSSQMRVAMVARLTGSVVPPPAGAPAAVVSAARRSAGAGAQSRGTKKSSRKRRNRPK